MKKNALDKETIRGTNPMKIEPHLSVRPLKPILYSLEHMLTIEPKKLVKPNYSITRLHCMGFG